MMKVKLCKMYTIGCKQGDEICFRYNRIRWFDTLERQTKEVSDFIWDFGKLPFPEHLGIFIIQSWKISAKIYEIGKIKVIFGLGMTPI